MAEYDGAGFPLSYCVLSTASAITQGKRIHALAEWAKCIRDQYDIQPSFALIDKDMAEIAMLRDEGVWVLKILLCWWHLHRAVKERLERAKLETTPYDPQKAHDEFPFISPTIQPNHPGDDAEHEGGYDTKALQPQSRPNAIPLKITVPPGMRPVLALSKEMVGHYVNRSEGSEGLDLATTLPPIRIPAPKKSEWDIEALNMPGRTFCLDEYRTPILEMLQRHYCAHPLIPGMSSPTPEGIREWAVKEMYQYCARNDLIEVWAYLWQNWYRTGRWELWARSTSPEIPRLTTTMIVESQ